MINIINMTCLNVSIIYFKYTSMFIMRSDYESTKNSDKCFGVVLYWFIVDTE